MRTLAFTILCVTGLVSAGDVATLEWLAGCWSGQAGSITVEEQWTKPVGGKMMGMARTLKQNQAIFSEFMRIEQKGSDAVFTPRIGTSQPSVSFTSIQHTATEVVFENATHDFPQRVIYRKVEGGVFARVEGKEKGKDRHEDFPMKRVPCEAGR